MKKVINRRSFLRGGAGTMVALPLLEAMFTSSAAFADAPGLHPRLFSFYVPNSTIEPRWYPKNGTKTNFDLTNTALAPFQEMGFKNDISLYQGLSSAGKYGSGNAHMRAIAGFLTGAAIRNDAVTTHKISIDQALANAHQQASPTRIHSLQLAGNPELDSPNNNRYNNQLKNSLAFDASGRILPNTANLKNVFDKLFAGMDPGEATTAVNRRQALQLSVLDSIKRDRDKLMQTLGQADRQRMEEYFTSLRELEMQINSETMAPVVGGCTVPNINAPATSDTARNNRIGDHAKIMAKIMAAAFRCDLTRVVTYMSGGEAAGCSYADIGVNLHFHNSISHNRGQHEDLHHKIDTFHSELVANTMKELESVPHGAGTLLDGTAIIYGAGLGNGDNHSLDRIAFLVGGRFGNFQHGRHHTLNGVNHAEVLNTVRRELGLAGNSFGDSGNKTVAIS